LNAVLGCLPTDVAPGPPDAGGFGFVDDLVPELDLPELPAFPAHDGGAFAGFDLDIALPEALW
jgi:hypothetical protein